MDDHETYHSMMNSINTSNKEYYIDLMQLNAKLNHLNTLISSQKTR